MTRRMLLEGPGCVCEDGAANLISMEWLVSNPTILLWADCIIVSQKDFDFVCSGDFIRDDPLLSETFALFFECLRAEGLIETFDSAKTIPHASAESVIEQVLLDIERYGTAPRKCEDGKMLPGVIETPSGSFCGFALESIYTNLLASRMLGCSCLMDRHKAEYVNWRFSAHYPINYNGIDAFQELYSVLIPEVNPHETHQLFCSKGLRETCAKADECSRQTKRNIKGFVDYLLITKSKPEIVGLSSLVEKLEIEMSESDSSEISSAALKDILITQRRVHGAFGNVKRWMRFVGEASVAAMSIAPSAALPEVFTPIAGVFALGGFAASAVADAQMKANDWKITFAERFSM